MQQDLLKNYFKQITPLSDCDLNSIASKFVLQKISKGQLVLQQGEVCKFEGFVTKGCFRIFTIDKNGNERNLYIAVENWWLMDIDSFMNNTPSSLNIEALECSEVLFISKADKNSLYDDVPATEKLFRIMSQKAVSAWQKRLVRNHCLTAKERYHHLYDTYPSIVARLNDRQIAKYLGISHEFLSKIKKGK